MCMYGSGGRSGKVDFLMGLSMLLKSLNSTLKVSQLHYKEINKKKKKSASLLRRLIMSFRLPFSPLITILPPPLSSN